MECSYDHRSLNDRITSAARNVTNLIGEYYDLAENEKLDKSDREKLEELATELKMHTLALQDMLGKTPEDTKTSNDDEDSDDSGEDFVNGLLGDLPKIPSKNIKVVKIKKETK